MGTSPRTSNPPHAGTPAPTQLSFDAFLLDPETGRLYEGDRVVPLAPKPFETLLYMAHRPGRVVSKTELMEKLWPGTFVTDDVLVQCVVEIRRALGDTAKSPRYIQTIPRRGYQFVAGVRVVQPTTAADAPPTPAEPTPPPLVLPPEAAAVSEPASVPAPLVEPPAGPAPTPPARLGVPAAAVLVLLLAAAAWWGGRQWESRGAAPRSAASAEPGALLVMPVVVEEATAQSRWLRTGLAEMIRSQLGQTPGLHIVARHRLAAALAQAGYGEDSTPSAPVATSLARDLGAESLVTGSFVRVDDRFVLSAQVLEVASGRTVSTATVRGKHPGELLDGVDELCLKLLQDLRPQEPQGVATWRPTRLATRSLEASRHYVEALNLFAQGGRKAAEEAEARLDEALKLDPAFAQAFVKKAEIQHWRRRWGFGDPDPAPAVRAAVRLIKDLPDRERLLVESFQDLIVDHDPNGALRHWSSLLQFYPTYGQEVGIPGLVADTFLQLGRWDDLIMVGEAHVESPSLPDGERARLSFFLSQAFRRKGELDRALLHARRAVTLWPARHGPRFLSQRINLGRVSLEAGRREEALAEFQGVSEAPEGDVTTLTDAAWGLYMAGEPDKAASLVDRALATDASYGNAYHLRGWLQLARGDHARAAESLQTAFARTPPSFGNPHLGTVNGDIAALYYSGVAHLKAGDRARSRQAFEQLMDVCKRLLAEAPADKLSEAGPWQAASYLARAAARLSVPAPDPPRLQGDDTTYFVQTARLHAVSGRTEAALHDLAQGLSLGHGEYRHVHDDPDFDALRETAEFRRLVTDRLPR